MGAFFSKQPNGLYCRFSTVVDTVTDWNMDEKRAINEMFGYTYKKRSAEEMALLTAQFNRRLRPFNEVKSYFQPANNTVEEFESILKEMGDTEGFTEEEKQHYKEWLES